MRKRLSRCIKEKFIYKFHENKLFECFNVASFFFHHVYRLHRFFLDVDK